MEIEGIRLGLTFFDPYVAILNSKRFELASSDDSALVWQDGIVSVAAPEDGTYVVLARGAAYAGNANSLYRLHVGNFPRPTATVPAGGKTGEEITVRWIGDVLGERTTSLTLPRAPDHHFGLFAQDGQGIAPFSNPFRLSPFGNTIEVEPNNTPASANPFTPPVALNGVIATPGDHCRSPQKGGPDYTYRVEISPVAPRLKLSTPNESPRRGTGTMAVAVPRKNRQAILINAARADFGGALSLSASGLPAGVAHEADTIGPGNDVVPVLFTAAPEAPVAATLAVVTGRPVDLKLDVPSEFASVAELVLGQNSENRNILPGRRVEKPVLPGGDHPEWRARHPQPRHGQAAHRQTPATGEKRSDDGEDHGHLGGLRALRPIQAPQPP